MSFFNGKDYVFVEIPDSVWDTSRLMINDWLMKLPNDDAYEWDIPCFLWLRDPADAILFRLKFGI